MPTKAKKFDCVQMKRQAQERLEAEYRSRRGEFGSYAEFLAATIAEDPWQRRVWAKACGQHRRGPRRG